MIVVATMTIRRAALAQFRAFERGAAEIMRAHGGAIERALELDDDPTGETLRELHVVRFPDDAAFAAYRADARLAALRPLREASVVATELAIATAELSY